MIRTRILIGSLFAAIALGLLFGDASFAPWFPVLFVLLIVVGVLSTRELVRLLPFTIRPSLGLSLFGVVLVTAANWYPATRSVIGSTWPPLTAWEAVLFAFAGFMLVAFLMELYRYREPGSVVPRLGLTILVVAYLALLGSFLIQIRWLDLRSERTNFMLVLTIFVPKGGDVGAYFTGRFLGRHPMAPILSPKKTWEGFVGGMLAAALVSLGLSEVAHQWTGTIFAGGIPEALVFGLVVGVAGVLGDLAESLIKRDCQVKDASRSIPGFGGLLDVIDSVLFAAPVAYCWFRFLGENAVSPG